MTKQKIAYFGGEQQPYDVLLDEFEVGMKVTDYDPLFEGLRARLVPLLHKIQQAQKDRPDPTLPDSLTFSIPAQTDFCSKVAQRWVSILMLVEWTLQRTLFLRACGPEIRVSRLDLMNWIRFPVFMQ
jgi:hypothetical protein